MDIINNSAFFSKLQLLFSDWSMIIAILFVFGGIFIFGLVIGSFLNAVMYRLRHGMNFFNDRSQCVHCTKKLSWRELIPVVSYVIQQGKCRKCNKKIPAEYIWVELITAVLFVYSSIIIPDFEQLFFVWIFIALSVVIFVYDLKYMLIEDKISVPFMILIAWYQLLFNPQNFLQYVLTGCGIALFFIVQIILTKGKGVGGGDIRLGFIMGLLLGWSIALYALMTSYILALIWIFPLLVMKLVTMKSKIPLGPFLVVGMLLYFFHGQELVQFFMNHLIL